MSLTATRRRKEKERGKLENWATADGADVISLIRKEGLVTPLEK
jgi:hypothetical protein